MPVPRQVKVGGDLAETASAFCCPSLDRRRQLSAVSTTWSPSSSKAFTPTIGEFPTPGDACETQPGSGNRPREQLVDRDLVQDLVAGRAVCIDDPEQDVSAQR